MGMKRLLILGAGVFAEEVADLARETGAYEVAAYVEGKDPTKVGHAADGVPVRWLGDLIGLDETYVGIGAMGTTRRKGFIEQAEAMGLPFVQLRHPSAQCSSLSEIGLGSILSRGVIVAAKARIGCHVVVNRGCLIGHHSEIGDYCTLSPGANIVGGTRIEEGVYVGMGAIILNGVTIGAHSIVGAGAVVTRDVPSRVQVLGIPARVTREGIEGL